MNTNDPSQNILWRVREIQESSEELLAMLDNPDSYRPQLQPLTLENRKREWLTARVLLKELLGEEKEILYTSAGKPYLADHSYYISISHTKNYVAVIVDKEHPVGIDIEYMSPRISKIRNQFMSKDEELHLSREHENIHLLLHWSAKETLFKVIGKENVTFKEQLHIQPFAPLLHTLSSFSGFETRTSENRSYHIHYFVHTDYVLTFTRNQ